MAILHSRNLRAHRPAPPSAARPLLGALALAFAVACGSSEEAPRPSGPAMSATGSDATSTAQTLPPSNRAPQIESLRLVPARPAAGQQVRVEIDAHDPDGDSLTYMIDWRLEGRPLGGENGERAVLRGARKGHLVEVHVTAHDGLSASEIKVLAVRVGNRAPDVDGIVFEPAGEMIAGRHLHARTLASDPDGDSLRFEYEWLVDGRNEGDGGPDFSTDGLRRGDQLQVVVTATDGEARSERFATPVFQLTNAPPVVDFEPIPPSPEGGVAYRLPARDPDGDALRFRLREGPEGMTVVSTRGLIEWLPRPDQTGTHKVVIEVDDLHGGITVQEFTMQVGDEPTPAAPAR